MLRCPTAELVLRCLEDDDQRPRVRQRILRHLDRCARCREEIDRRTRGELEPKTRYRPSAAGETFRAPAAEPVPAGLIERLQRLGHTEDQGGAPGGLDFLGPPTVAGDLGAFGPYRVVAELGRGGMGIVLKGHDPTLQRDVAIKVLPPWQTTAETRGRFLREARAASRIDHPNIVPVHAYGSLPDGRPYLVMPLIAGRSLEERLRHGPPPDAATAARWALGMAEGLAAVHRGGLVHRDIKPANVLIDAEGAPRLTDFGLAVREAGDETITVPGQVLGTPAYMSPEQARGEGSRVDARSDVYSLGVVLYRMLAGELPFRGSVRMLLRQIEREPPPAPRSLNDRVPRDLETICLTCLEKEPAARYAGAAAMADDLRRFLAGQAIVARPPGPLGRLRRWASRRPGAAAAAVLSLLVFGLTIALAVHQTRSADRLAAAQARTHRALRAAERLSALALLDRGQAQCEAGDVGRGMLEMARGLQISPPEEPLLDRALRRNLAAWQPRLPALRAIVEPGDEVRGAATLDGGRRLLTCGPGGAQIWDAATGRRIGPILGRPGTVTLSAAASPDGRRIATGGDDGRVRFWDAATGRPVEPEITTPKPVTAVAFSPDGKRLGVSGENETAQIYDADSGQPIGAEMRHHTTLTSVAFSPDGARVATGSFDRTARVWDAATGAPVGEPLPHGGGVMTVRFSPDGATLLTTCEDGAATLWNLADNRPRTAPMRHRNRVLDARFSPDGRLVLTASQDRTTRFWDAADGLPLGGPLIHPAPVDAVAFLPDGSAFWTGLRDGTARLWEVVRPGPAAWLQGHDAAVMAVACRTDGSTALTAGRDGRVLLWDVPQGKPLREMKGHDGVVFSVAVSGDGRTAVSGGKDGFVRLWRLPEGTPAAPPISHGGPVYDVAISPDGRVALSAGQDGAVRLWNVADATPAGPPLRHDGPVYDAVFSPDGRLVLSGGEDRTARLWRVADGTPIGAPLVHPSPVNAVAFRSDGQRFATGSQRGAVRLWDISPPRPDPTPLQHEGQVETLAFSPDGATLLVGGQDRTARLWDLATRRVIGPPLEHREAVRAVAILPDGRAALVASFEPRVALWPLPRPTPEPAERLARRLRYLSGLELDAEGIVTALPAARWKRLQSELAAP